MKQKFTQVFMLIGLLSLLLVPNSVLAASDGEGVAFRVAYGNGVYRVYMRPSQSPTGPAITLTAQVTLKVPHATGADRFQVADLSSGVAGAEWVADSRIDAPTEDANADYVSFTVAFPDGNYQAFDWQADQEIEVFSFANEGACLGAVALLENSDPFTTDAASGRINSANTNPGNQIDVLNLGEGNLYAGTYGSAANCSDRTTELKNYYWLPLINNH